jgi:hypothetical protein
MSGDVAVAPERGLDENRDRSDRVGVGLARHGIPGLRGQVEEGARYGYMFSRLAQERRRTEVLPDAFSALASAMIEAPGSFDPNTKVPAGYTYFGQFVDHDLTFDPTSTLGRRNEPQELPDFRTPRFDLDSLYGSGPMDQPFLYDWSLAKHQGVKLLVGRNPEGREFAREDLPRNQHGRALTGDARNDENLIIAQLHLLFIRFHNKVVDLLSKDPNIRSNELFEQAQELVRWHYQWIVKNDFLPLIVSDDIEDFELERFRWEPGDRPFMPVEFSAGAFRFGHSMVRNDYKLNDDHPNVPILKRRSPFGPTLAGFRRLPRELEIDWKHFFFTDQSTFAQRSMRIDTRLSAQLAQLPPDNASLPYLNLRRGTDLGVPLGGDVAGALEIEGLTEEELLAPLPEPIPERVRELVVNRTPLWYYVLCEAKARGNRGLCLGPTGGRIVAGVINGLLRADCNSYVNAESEWTPELPRHPDKIHTMADLVKFVLGPAVD